MHQIQFRLGLRWGSLQRSPDPLAGFKGPTSEGRGGQGRAGKGARRERGGKGSGGIGEGEGGKENGDRPPTIFGLKVALQLLVKNEKYVLIKFTRCF